MKWAALLAVLMIAGPVQADPLVSLTLDAKDANAAFASLAEQLDEPIGLVALAKNAKLGLAKGDVVRSINGAAASRLSLFDPLRGSTTLLYLDVLRGKKALTIRIQLKVDHAEDHDERDSYKHHLEQMQQLGPEHALSQVTRDGNPSGVAVRLPWIAYGTIAEGDIIRKIDGQAIDTVEHAMTAFDRAKDHAQLLLELDRGGQTVTVAITLDDPPKEEPEVETSLGKIKKLNDTSYEIPRELLDVLFGQAKVKTARIVPAIKDGKPSGFKIYAVRPGSPFDALGLQNGDSIQLADGAEIGDMAHALEVLAEVRKHKTLKLGIVRRGQDVSIDYKLK